MRPVAVQVLPRSTRPCTPLPSLNPSPTLLPFSVWDLPATRAEPGTSSSLGGLSPPTGPRSEALCSQHWPDTQQG